MVRFLVCAAFAGAALAADPCAARAQASSPARAAWTPVVRTAAVTASVDTTRVERVAGGAARLWYRLAFATPLSLGDDAGSRFAATEMRLEVDCRGARARTLALRMETVDGVQADVPASDTAWKGFAEHSLGAGVLGPTCAALGTPAGGAPAAATTGTAGAGVAGRP